MKETKEKKLSLKKTTIWNHDSILDRDEQKAARGGTGNELRRTEIIIFC
jgi:hypothetical protein